MFANVHTRTHIITSDSYAAAPKCHPKPIWAKSPHEKFIVHWILFVFPLPPQSFWWNVNFISIQSRDWLDWSQIWHNEYSINRKVVRCRSVVFVVVVFPCASVELQKYPMEIKRNWCGQLNSVVVDVFHCVYESKIYEALNNWVSCRCQHYPPTQNYLPYFIQNPMRITNKSIPTDLFVCLFFIDILLF